MLLSSWGLFRASVDSSSDQPSPGQHRPSSLGSWSPSQGALLLPRSPEPQGDPAALAIPAACGPSAEGACSGLTPPRVEMSRIFSKRTNFTQFRFVPFSFPGQRLRASSWEEREAHLTAPTPRPPLPATPIPITRNDTSWTPTGWDSGMARCTQGTHLGPVSCVDSTLLMTS